MKFADFSTSVRSAFQRSKEFCRRNRFELIATPIFLSVALSPIAWQYLDNQITYRGEDFSTYLKLRSNVIDQAYTKIRGAEGLKPGEAFVDCQNRLCVGLFVGNYPRKDSSLATITSGGKELKTAKADQASGGESYFIDTNPSLSRTTVANNSRKPDDSSEPYQPSLHLFFYPGNRNIRLLPLFY